LSKTPLCPFLDSCFGLGEGKSDYMSNLSYKYLTGEGGSLPLPHLFCTRGGFNALACGSIFNVGQIGLELSMSP